ncbi:MAG: type-F conjugative transfer system pilin assembly protein TrbC [Pseudoruegeria sp.]
MAQNALPAEIQNQIDEALEKAKRDGQSLRERIAIMSEYRNMPEGIADMGKNSLKNTRVREVLGIAGNIDTLSEDEDGERYPSGLYVFASFSMPAQSLRQLLIEASDLGVPVVFRGFHNNSAFETEAVLRDLYENHASASRGFNIDPTLFTRFSVTAVPTFVATTADLDVCETSGCLDDPSPDHDVVRGNITVRTAFEIIAKGGGPAAKQITAVLERAAP